MTWPTKSLPLHAVAAATDLHGHGGRQGKPAASGLAAVEYEDEAWKLDANCRDVTDREIFFPSRGASIRPAKEICARCTVRDECLEYALRNGDTHGIWGGKSERERRRLRRERAGIAIRGGSEPMFSMVDRQRIVRLDKKGWTDGDIAREFGCTQRTIVRVLARERQTS